VQILIGPRLEDLRSADGVFPACINLGKTEVPLSVRNN
jgi:hypothetical protein